MHVFHVKEYSFELHEGNNPIVLEVVFLHDLIKFFLCNVISYFAHGVYNVVLSYRARPIRVKLVEDSLKHPVVQERLNVQSCHDELSVVYLTIALVVHFIYYLVDLLVRDVNVTCLNRFL